MDHKSHISIAHSLFDTTGIPPDAQKILNSFDTCIQDIRPLSSKQRQELPHIIRLLSHSLTDERKERRIGYANESALRSAYTHYFMWWNLIRLVPLFASFPPEVFFADAPLPNASVPNNSSDAKAIFLDIGSGPLTVPIALYLAQPQLRTVPVTFYCVDISHKTMSLGEELFFSIASKLRGTQNAADSTSPVLWNIVRVADTFGTHIKHKVDTVFCANMFNELYWNSTEALESISKRYATQLHSYTKSGGGVFVVEPGVPRAARFISLLRNSLQRIQYVPIAPCPHNEACPMQGQKNGKWCHFVCDMTHIPPALQKLSHTAGIPKERATLSFIFSSQKTTNASNVTAVLAPHVSPQNIAVRIVSDIIHLSTHNPQGKAGAGRYACSSLGLTLVGGQGAQGWAASDLHSGDLIFIPVSANRSIDTKSNAVILPILQK